MSISIKSLSARWARFKQEATRVKTVTSSSANRTRNAAKSDFGNHLGRSRFTTESLTDSDSQGGSNPPCTTASKPQRITKRWSRPCLRAPAENFEHFAIALVAVFGGEPISSIPQVRCAIRREFCDLELGYYVAKFPQALGLIDALEQAVICRDRPELSAATAPTAPIFRAARDALHESENKK